MARMFLFNDYDHIVFKKSVTFYVLYLDAEKRTCVRPVEVGRCRITMSACRALVALDKISPFDPKVSLAQDAMREFMVMWYGEVPSSIFVSMGYTKPMGTYLWTPSVAENIPGDFRVLRGDLSFSKNGVLTRSRTPPPLRSRVW